MKDFVYCPFCRHKLAEKHVDGRLRGICKKCGWIYYRNPLPAVSCLVSRGKEILLIRRAIEPYKGAWCIAGGFVEMGETLPEAGVRELQEETGLTGKCGKFVGAYVQKSLMYGAVLIVGMEFKVKRSDKLVPGDDAMDAQFFNVSDMPDVPLESHRNLIRDYLRK